MLFLFLFMKKHEAENSLSVQQSAELVRDSQGYRI